MLTKGLVALFAFAPLSVHAQASTPAAPAADSTNRFVEPSGDRLGELVRRIPSAAYAYTALGAPTYTLGVQVYGLGSATASGPGALGGGASVWAAPVNRLTLIGDAREKLTGDFSPSVAVIVRLSGDRVDGLAIASMAKFKVDGFAGGPSRDEIESEIELGALLSYTSPHWYVDANVLAGKGMGDDGETDAEGRLRLGRRFGSWLTLGFDSQSRIRLSGPALLSNGRSWDFAAGAQMVACVGNLFGALTTGPTTTDIASRSVSWSAMASFGGSTL